MLVFSFSKKSWFYERVEFLTFFYNFTVFLCPFLGIDIRAAPANGAYCIRWIGLYCNIPIYGQGRRGEKAKDP